MKMSKTLTAITAAGMLGVMSLGSIALADGSETAKVEAAELENNIKLHPMLGEYGLSVMAQDDGSLVIEGMIDDQEGYNALNELIEEHTQSSTVEVENNVVRS